jgi:guanylate kinase
MGGLLIVISAPSGTGKTTILNQLTRSSKNLKHSISMTTRPPRSEELNGRDYLFVSQEDFEKKIEQDEFAEWAVVHGNLYGTPKKTLEEAINAGIDVILDIDVQGAIRIKEKYKEGVLIFIAPPNMEELRARLKKRNTESEEAIEQRLEEAKKELEWLPKYDYYIVNHRIKDTVSKVKAIIEAEKCRVNRFYT